jgi:hypothetical protein
LSNKKGPVNQTFFLFKIKQIFDFFLKLKNRQIELTELEEEKTKIEQKYFEERDREKLLILFLLEERANLLKEIEELQIVNKTSTGFFFNLRKKILFFFKQYHHQKHYQKHHHQLQKIIYQI